MILQTAFFRFRSVLACWLLVVGCRLYCTILPTTDNQQPTTNTPQKMLSNEVAALFRIVFNGC